MSFFGLFDGSNITKAANAANAQVTAASQPYITEEQQYLNNVLKPAMTEQNPFLQAQHEANLNQVGSTAQTQGQNALGYWSQFGNTGRGRGEAGRASLAGVQGANAENTNYGINTTNLQDRAKQGYFSGLGNLANFSTGIAEGEAQRGYGAAVEANNTMTSTVGEMLGMASGFSPGAAIGKIFGGGGGTSPNPIYNPDAALSSGGSAPQLGDYSIAPGSDMGTGYQPPSDSFSKMILGPSGFTGPMSLSSSASGRTGSWQLSPTTGTFEYTPDPAL
jgi:hypothetical protein